MSGILDSKSRVLDTIITLEGRRQLVDSKMKIEYVSFTDGSTYYMGDVVSGSADASTRLYLEQCSLPQDQVTFESDDSGRLKPFKNASNATVKDGKLIKYVFDGTDAAVLSGSSQGMQFLKGDEFTSTADTLLLSSIDNFSKLRIIGTKDRLFEDDGFSVGPSTVTFTMTNDRPIKDSASRAAHVDHIESLFQDVRLSKLKNFKYLPPINKVDDVNIDKKDYRQTWKHHMGTYHPLGRTHIDGLSPQQLEHELSYYIKLGCVKTATFEPTSLKSNVVAQFFEVNDNQMRKLDVIDYGTYVWGDSPRRAFFVGKVFVDGNGTHTFVHMFTLVFGTFDSKGS